MNNKKIATLLIWVLVALAVVWMASGFDLSGKQAEELDYNTEFLALVQRTEMGDTSGNTIKAIQIQYRDVYGLYTGSTASAEDLPKNADFHVVIPSETTFRADMAAIVYAAHSDRFSSVDEVSSHDYSFAYESKIVEESIWTIILPYLLLLVAIGALYYFMMRQQGGGKQMMNFGRSRARLQVGDANKVTFADVAGADEEKEELREVVEFMREPQRFNEIGARIPKGVLLVGPPGTGKTLLAKAVAGEAKVPFFSISGSDFVEMFVGVGASRVRDLFQTAKRSTPAVVFIDEIDAVGRHRGAGMGGGHDEREQTLNQLLVEMDGFGSNDGVIVMAATNRRDILDPALLRPGRFDRQIYVNVPDVGGREAILRVHARDKQLSDDVDLRTVARATAGFTGADLENLLNEAALISARKNLPVITMQTMEDAVLKVIAGPEKRSLVNIERDRRITAIHEAGHAVAAYFLSTQEPVHQITIVPRGNALGLTISLPDQDTLHTTRNEMRDRIVVLLGGRVAEQLEFDDISTGASNDLQRATKLAHDMIAKYGMNERIGAVAYDDDSEIFVGRDYERTRSYSEQTAAEIDAEVRKTVDQAYAHCTQILTEHHEKLQEIAQWLLEHETMSRSQFEACMQALPIPEKQEGLLAGEEKTDGAEED